MKYQAPLNEQKIYYGFLHQDSPYGIEGSFSKELRVSGLRLEIKTSWKALLPEANILPHSEYEG